MEQESRTPATQLACTADLKRKEQTVYVLMSENDGGVAGIVCATRARAEDELREILSEYITREAGGTKPTYSAEAIASLVQETRHSSINPCQDNRYWIDECPVHR